ncbi:hypothetical protein Aduo_011420 [Ancylostoma duodenale]
MAYGLYALIGDGVHKLNPKTIPDRMDKGQLYIVPILYAVTCRKTVATYKAIFKQLKDIIDTGEGLRIILDFEKAAIRAASVHECPSTRMRISSRQSLEPHGQRSWTYPVH